MQTLDFGEYCQMKRFLGLPVNTNPVAEFDAYILEGGFPKAMDYPGLADKRAYVAAVIQEIFEKDIRRRVKIKNVSMFSQVRDYVINNFGATTSLANIQSDLESKRGVKIKRETLARYLQILEDAKIVSKCARFDLKSRKSLRGEQKYYLADLSFYFALNTDNRINYGPVLENIVYRYARAQGCKVSVGRIGKLECDFILRNPEMGYAYVQVAMTIIAMMFGGIMEGTHQLEVVVNKLKKLAKGPAGLVTLTEITCVISNMTMPEQYISIVVPGRMYAEEYRKMGLHPAVLSSALEGAGTVTSPLVPWNTCGVYISDTLDIGVAQYGIYAIFNWLMPVVNALCAYVGITLKDMDNKPYKKQAAAK